MYDKLVSCIRFACEIIEGPTADLLTEAADAIEELSREAEQSKRKLDAILPWFGEFLMDMDEDGLKEIINAKREDRLIILPVTSGTPIFVMGLYSRHIALDKFMK